MYLELTFEIVVSSKLPSARVGSLRCRYYDLGLAKLTSEAWQALANALTKRARACTSILAWIAFIIQLQHVIFSLDRKKISI